MNKAEVKNLAKIVIWAAIVILFLFAAFYMGGWSLLGCCAAGVVIGFLIGNQ